MFFCRTWEMPLFAAIRERLRGQIRRPVLVYHRRSSQTAGLGVLHRAGLVFSWKVHEAPRRPSRSACSARTVWN